MRHLCLLLSLSACSPSDKNGSSDGQPDSGGPDSGDSGDSADSGDSGDSADTGDPVPPEWADQAWYGALRLPADQGMAWERDPDWGVENVTVPTIVVLNDGSYRMMATLMTDRGNVYMWSSDDGVTWSDDGQKILGTDDYADCGELLLDTAIVYLDDGSYRLLVEGQREDEFASRVFCSATSTDGDTWIPEAEPAYEGSEGDMHVVSVPEVVRVDSGDWLLYYVGNLASLGGEGDGIRAARSTNGHTFEPLTEENLLSAHDTDPWPVLLDDGRLRLYHTHPVTSGRIGTTHSEDGVAWPDESETLEGMGMSELDDELWLDPSVVRLPDGRIVMYYTRIVGYYEGDRSPHLGRAWATDAAAR